MREFNYEHFTYFSSLVIHAISLVLRPFHILAASNQKLDRVKDLEMSLVDNNYCQTLVMKYINSCLVL